MNIANYSQSLPAKGWAHDSSLALWGVAVTGLGPEMQTLTAPSDCSLGQDWWLLLNHFFISSNAGTTIPGFLLEVQESLTVRVSGMASDWFCIQPVLLSQTHGFPWGYGVSQSTWEWVQPLHKPAYFSQIFTAYPRNEGAEAKLSPHSCWKASVKEEAGSDWSRCYVGTITWEKLREGVQEIMKHLGIWESAFQGAEGLAV